MSSKNRIEMLLHDLSSEEEAVRENSAYLLGENAHKAREMARNTLKDDETLASLNPILSEDLNQKVLDGLVKAVFDRSGWVRGNAAEALGKIGSEQAVSVLITALKDEEKIVRYSAAEALGKIKDHRSTDALIDALNDENWSVRASAAEALKYLDQPRAISALQKALNDSHQDVQHKAADALACLSQNSTAKKTTRVKKPTGRQSRVSVK